MRSKNSDFFDLNDLYISDKESVLISAFLYVELDFSETNISKFMKNVTNLEISDSFF